MVYVAAFDGGDEELLQALIDGRQGASTALYERYGGHVLRVLARVMGRDPELHDLLHEVFIQALNSVHGVRSGARLKAWLTSVAVFTARGAIRKRQRLKWLGFRAPEQLPDPPSAYADGEVLHALRRTYAVLDKMGADTRIPFTLRHIEKMNLHEVAEACDVSLATIKRRLLRAEKRFASLARQEAVLRPWLENHPRWGAL